VINLIDCRNNEAKTREEPSSNKSCNQFLIINNNQNFVIEIDDENDFEKLYTHYPSTEYEISSVNKIVKEENSSNNVLTYQVTVTTRYLVKQAKIIKKIFNHYKKMDNF
jgi:hypothetical protein